MLKPVKTSQKCLCKIVVSLSLQQDIFVMLHASPSAEHMDEYKTLYRVNLDSFDAGWDKILKIGIVGYENIH